MVNNAAVPGFYEELFDALQLASNPAALGVQSPLAAPYFLGSYLTDQPEAIRSQPIGRGKALLSLLMDAANDLAEQHPRGEEYRRLLQLSFFTKRTKREGDVWDALGMARATYFRARKAAIEALEPLLIQRATPALRAEQPQTPSFFAGRTAEAETCRAGLAARQVVGLTGPSGIGKTTLAAHVLGEAPDRPVFWYTLHLGVNDHLGALVFALAHALHVQGASSLWLQLLADQGQVNLDTLPGLLRSDLGALAERDPVFCLDEIDLLQPEVEAHAQVLNFLESLPSGYARLFVGQTIPLLTDTYIGLDALPAASVRQILQHDQIGLASEPLAQLVEYTRGNPRLVALYVALHKSGEAIEEVLSQLSSAPSLEALLNRVWVRLSDRERAILLQLAVFRRPVPADMWRAPEEQAGLMRLVERQLVQSDGRGAVTVLAALRRTLYESVPTETREPLHLTAASIRSSRSEYTAAAYHLARAGAPEQAIRLWYGHRSTEIDQGQASTALHLFEEISESQLAAQAERETLRLVRAELHKLLGNYDRAQASLAAIQWRTPQLAARARRLAGDVAELRGELDVAGTAYREGLALADSLAETELVLFHRDLGWIFRRQKQFEAAWAEAQAATYEIENLKGHIFRDQGEFAEAEAQYRRALELARELKNADGEAKTRNALAALLIKQRRFAEADAHFDAAYQAFRRIGKIMSVASVRVNQAVACLLDDRPLEAVEYAEQARAIFVQLQHPYGLATALQTLAEGYLAHGDVERAEVYGWQAVEAEESAVIPDALRVIGEVYLARGDLNGAERMMHQAIDAARENGDRYLEAYGLRALGKVYQQSKDSRGAEVLGEAAACFTEIGLSTEAARTLALLG